jgi:hypothetical protein
MAKNAKTARVERVRVEPARAARVQPAKRVRTIEEPDTQLEDLVKLAANPHNLLHDDFTWNDAEAARQYRLLEAQELMRRYG